MAAQKTSVCSSVITGSYPARCDNGGGKPPGAGDAPALRTDHRAYQM